MDTLDLWLSENASRIDLQVQVFQNVLLEKFNISDIESSIQIDGKKYWGRGTTTDVNLSLRKSCCEAIERFFLHREKIATSNGMAVHLSPSHAINSATNELIERDLFLCHFLTQTPFKKIKSDVLWINNILDQLRETNIEISFYSMGSINSVEAILCTISGIKAKDSFGYIMGTAAGDKRDSSIESAFLEAFRNYAHLKRENSISLDTFMEKASQKNINFIDHGNLALNIEYANKALTDILTNDLAIVINEDFDLKMKDCFFDKKDTAFFNTPLYISRITSKSLQNLFVGISNEEKLNKERLLNFCKSYQAPYKIVGFPHPFN